MAAQAERLRGGGGQFDPGNIFRDSNFMAGQASSRNRRVNVLTFTLVFVALKALSRVHIFFERNWVGLGNCRHSRKNQNVRCQP